MSAGITSCCTPCAAVPVAPQQQQQQPEPTATGGGAPMKGQEPVSGGGTSYEPAPDPVACGQWVPAPVVVGGDTPPTSAPSGDAPPEPIAGPDTSSSNEPGAPATTPASQLPTWSQWNDHFTRLGLSQADLATLAASNLNDEQLAQVYEELHTSIVEAGGIPGETPIGDQAATSAWSAQWEQQFSSLGLPQAFVAEIKAEAMRTGATNEQIAGVYETVVREIEQQKGTQQTAPTQQDPTTQQVPGQQGDATQGPGWNAQIEQAFRGLGMPDEVIAIYAQSGAPASGLEAAYKHAAGRVEDLNQRGWIEKLTGAKADPVQMWSLILGDEPASDKDLRALYNASKNANMNGLQKAGQLATSLFPGGRLVQYLFGKEFVSGEEIDRTSPMEIGMAALSGLALFASIRGVKNLSQAWKLRDGGYLQLQGVNKTLEGLGMPAATAAGGGAAADVAMGATQTWGTKQKLLSLIPGTKLHKEVIGLAHAETAAKAFNTGAAAKLFEQPGGKLQVATLGQVFSDIRSGAMSIQGGANAYLGPLRSPKELMTLGAKNGVDVIKVAKNLKLGGNGQSQLVGLLQVGGTKLGQSPTWLQVAPNLVDDIGRLANIERQALGGVMASSAVKTLDFSTFTKDGLRPMRLLNKLGSTQTPQWFKELGEETSKQIGLGLTPERHALLTETATLTSMLDEAGTLIKGADRSKLSAEVAPLVDDAGAVIDDAKAGIERMGATGSIDEAGEAAFQTFKEKLAAIEAADPKVAKELFPSFTDAAQFQQVRHQASERVLAAARQSAAATTSASSVPAGAVAGDAVGFIGPKTQAEAAAAAAVVDDAAAFIGPKTQADAAAAAAAAAEEVSLTVGANGRVHTAAGLEIPSYSSLVTGFQPDGVTNDVIRRYAAMQNAIRGGV